MKTINAKVIILYFFLAVINITFFTIINFENQLDLITENTKYQANEKAQKVYSILNDLAVEVNSNPKNYSQIELIISEINKRIISQIKDYIIFKENGNIIYTSSPDLKISDQNKQDATRTITNKDFTGQLFFSRILEKNFEILFYIPTQIDLLDNAIILYKIKMNEINDKLNGLYRLVIIIISIIALFHIGFAFLLHRLLIRPVKALHKKSLEISNGDLSARVKITSKDEIGQLGNAFNTMADSIQDKINKLNLQNEKMLFELNMAGKVQTAIYPTVRSTEKFDLAVYHSPYTKVSGDYHDIFQINNNSYGFIIADVCGHGVPAALITMRIKELLRTAVFKFDDSKELIKYINTELSDLMNNFNSFFSAFYIILDDKNVITYSNAGHPKVYLVRSNSKQIFTLDTKGAVIGISEDINESYESKKGLIMPGDKLILVTDGIIEARNSNQEQYNITKFLATIRLNMNASYDEMLNNIVADLKNFVQDEPQWDDETMLIIQIKK